MYLDVCAIVDSQTNNVLIEKMVGQRTNANYRTDVAIAAVWDLLDNNNDNGLNKQRPSIGDFNNDALVTPTRLIAALKNYGFANFKSDDDGDKSFFLSLYTIIGNSSAVSLLFLYSVYYIFFIDVQSYMQKEHQKFLNTTLSVMMHKAKE